MLKYPFLEKERLTITGLAVTFDLYLPSVWMKEKVSSFIYIFQLNTKKNKPSKFPSISSKIRRSIKSFKKQYGSICTGLSV